MIRKVITGLCCIVVLVANAEEGGSGHYFPGSVSSFVDGVPATDTLITRLNVFSYDAQTSANVTIPIAMETAEDVDVKSKVVALTIAWRPSWGKLSDKWSYAMSATLPYVFMDVSATVSSPIRVQKQDKLSAVGDLVLMPLMFNYQYNADFSINLRTAVYAPTGDYKVGRLANTGKNFWTVEPTIGFMYFGQKNGREASVLFGMSFNQENDDTDYKSGNQFHLDYTFAQHFPFSNGLTGVGITGYFYRQTTGDSGKGASFGDFKARANGIGLTTSYVRKLSNRDLMVEFKWLHEYGVKRRVEGDVLMLKAMFKF